MVVAPLFEYLNPAADDDSHQRTKCILLCPLFLGAEKESESAHTRTRRSLGGAVAVRRCYQGTLVAPVVIPTTVCRRVSAGKFAPEVMSDGKGRIRKSVLLQLDSPHHT